MSRDDEAVTVEATEAATPAGAESTENLGTEQAAEAPAEVTEQQAEGTQPEVKQPEGPTAEELAALFKTFEEAVKAAVEERDKSTGTIPEAEVAKVKLAYVNLGATKSKTAARQLLDEGMKSALSSDLDAAKAKAYMDLGQEVKSTSAQRETVVRPPVDPTTAHVEKVTAFYLAVSLIPTPSDVSDDWTAKVKELAQSLTGDVQAYAAWSTAHDEWTAKAGTEAEASRGEEPKKPEVSSVVEQAARIAKGRASGASRAKAAATGGTSTTKASGAAYSGPRRSVKNHVRECFANQPVGTFLKTLQISKFQSAEYGDDRPSTGAITSALGSEKWDVPGIVPAEENGIAGARKVA